jgi:hypothetical protein
LRVLECCTGEGGRRCVTSAVLKIKYCIELRKKEIRPKIKLRKANWIGQNVLWKFNQNQVTEVKIECMRRR